MQVKTPDENAYAIKGALIGNRSFRKQAFKFCHKGSYLWVNFETAESHNVIYYRLSHTSLQHMQIGCLRDMFRHV